MAQPKKSNNTNDDESWPEDVKDDNDDKKNDDVNDDISCRISPASIDNKIHNIVLELTGSEKKGRCPVDICAVLDTSGSMNTSAAVQEDDGSVKNDDGLSILDSVKHSVKAVINCLSDKDRFSIVGFESQAQRHYELDYMTKDGMKKATNALEQLHPGGGTNLWAGLREGMESLRTKQQPGRLSVILLLTDGQPFTIPPNGHIYELKKYRDQYNFRVQINTFGFGYSLDSNLLHSLAVHGNGTFSFIPDAKIVGTTFVNSVANCLTTLSAETRLSLTCMNGSKFVGKSYGAQQEQDESWGRVIDIGPIMCGSTRYISIPMQIPNGKKPYLDCKINNIKKSIEGTQRTIAGDLFAGHLTAKVVSIGLEATELAVKKKHNDAAKLLESLRKEIKNATDIAKKDESDDFDQMTSNSRLEALNNDVCGRFSKSFDGDARFNRWGKHYLRALLRSHQLNMCTNFMDPGLQVNGGNLFRELRAKGDEVFINLPPPKPSRAVRNNNNNNNNNAAAAPAVDMTNYYGGSGGGCFAPYCNVIVMDNNTKQCITKQVSDVRPGDVVKVKDGFASVLFVVELSRDRRRRMVKFPNGLVITGGHPVRRNGLWCLPREQSDVQYIKGCDTVFTFVLNKSHVMIVNGMECITWGHGKSDDIVNHSFFGTEKVIQTLKQKARDMENNMDMESVNLLNNVIAIYQ